MAELQLRLSEVRRQIVSSILEVQLHWPKFVMIVAYSDSRGLYWHCLWTHDLWRDVIVHIM